METILSGNGSADPAEGAAGSLIKDSDTAGFMADVIEASRDVPVIVDFWATWCGPCKTLGPILEKIVTEARGAVRLVKIDVDQNQELSGQLRIQSIPTVYAFRNGQPVDAFQGALPESQVQAWVDHLIKQHGGAPIEESPLEQALAAADEAFEAGDLANAGALYAQILNHEAGNALALAGMARCYLKSNKPDKARELVEQASDEVRASDALQPILSALELAEAGSQAAGEFEELQARITDNPADHQARFDLATAQFAAGQAEAAIDQLVEIVRRDRGWNDEAAREQLIKIFEALGPTDPITIGGRRKLSSVLFS